MNIPPESELLAMIYRAERDGFTHSAAALRGIYARNYTQPRRQDERRPEPPPTKENTPATK